MNIVKVIKLPKLFQKKKAKSYSLTPLGQCKMEFDIKQAKQGKIDNAIYIVAIIAMFGFGFMTKEFLIMILAGKGMGKFAGWMIG